MFANPWINPWFSWWKTILPAELNFFAYSSPSSRNGSNPAVEITAGGKFDKSCANKGETKGSSISSNEFTSSSLNHLFGHKNFSFIKGDVTNKKLIMWAKSKNLPIFVYTVNTREEYLYVEKLGVSGIITDDPLKLKQIKKEKAFVN